MLLPQPVLVPLYKLQKIGMKSYSSVGYYYLGEIYSDLNQNPKAIENLTLAESMFQKVGMDFWLGKTQKLIDRVQ